MRYTIYCDPTSWWHRKLAHRYRPAHRGAIAQRAAGTTCVPIMCSEEEVFITCHTNKLSDSFSGVLKLRCGHAAIASAAHPFHGPRG